VHNIVEATNEAIRNVARDMSEIKPYVLSLQVKEAEERGAQRERLKTRAIVVSALGVIGTGMMYLLSKFAEWLFVVLTSRPK
jgi:hypothetical protein